MSDPPDLCVFCGTLSKGGQEFIGLLSTLHVTPKDSS